MMGLCYRFDFGFWVFAGFIVDGMFSSGNVLECEDLLGFDCFACWYHFDYGYIVD